jgi:hypothetical protein
MSIQTGQQVEFKSDGPITREQLKNYALASGDSNPIHLDEEVAKRVGLPGIIAHGMLIAAKIAERAKEFVSAEAQLQGFELVKFQSRFKAMTLLGDTPSYGGVVKDFNGQELVLDLQAKNQRGEVTTQGTARFKK